MSADAYQGGGGWTGGSPLTGGSGGVYGGTDSLLGSYMQPLKQYNADTGAMGTARPAQSNSQMSSLARTIQAPEGTAAQYNTQPTAATPSTQAPVTVNVQAPAQTSTFANAMAAPAGMSMMGGRQALAVDPSQTLQSAGNTGTMSMMQGRGAAIADSGGMMAGRQAASVPFKGQATIVTGSMGTDGVGSNTLRNYDAATGQYVPTVTLLAKPSADRSSAQYILQTTDGRVLATGPDAYTRFVQMKGFLGGDVLYQGANETEALQKAMATNAGAISENQAQVGQVVGQYNAANQSMIDNLNAAAAQRALDKASAFDLSGALQAPNTSAVDAAGQADLARLISKYAASGYGPEASSLAALGSRDAASQAAVNKANHNSAYADAYNTNYGIFADALKAQRDTSVAASAQRLNYDMQGVQDAVSQLAQQATQLTGDAQTRTVAALLPLQKALQNYSLAVSTYKANSDEAKKAAQLVLSLAGSLAAAAV